MSKSTGNKYFLVAVLLGVLIVAAFVLLPFFAPLTLACVFAVILYPVYQWFVRKTKGHESLSALATVILAILCILAPASLIGAQILSEAQSLYASIASGSAQAQLNQLVLSAGTVADRYVPGSSAQIESATLNLNSYVTSGLTWLIQHFGVAFSGVTALVLDLFVFFISLYYLLRDGAALMREIIRLSPLNDGDDKAVFARLTAAVNSVVKGKLAIALIQGVFAGVGFVIFGVPNAVLWGLAAVFTALIPPIGTAFVAIPAVAYLSVFGGLAPALGLALWSAVAGIIDNVFGPQLMGRGAQIHPLLVFLSVLGGISFFGPVGVFIGPLTMSLLLALLSIYESFTDGHLSTKPEPPSAA